MNTGPLDFAPASAPPGSLLRTALAWAGVALFFTGIDNYAFSAWAAPRPVVFIYAFAAAAVALTATSPRTPVGLLRSPFLLWVLGYAMMTFLWAIGSQHVPGAEDALRARIRSIGFLVAFALIFEDPRARRAGHLAVIAAVLLAVALNVAEFLGVAQFSVQEGRVPGRAGGFYVNANGAAFAIVLGLAATLPRVAERFRLPLLVAGGLGVVATFSRGAELCLGLLVLYFFVRREIPRGRFLALVVALLAATIALPQSPIRTIDSAGLLTSETEARLRFTQSDSGRASLAQQAWDKFTAAPLTGHGLAATESPHNQFLALAGDHGILGLLALPALALALGLWNPAGLPLALGLLAGGIFSHNLLDDRASLLVIALVAAGRAVRAGARADARGAEPDDVALAG